MIEQQRRTTRDRFHLDHCDDRMAARNRSCIGGVQQVKANETLGDGTTLIVRKGHQLMAFRARNMIVDI